MANYEMEINFALKNRNKIMARLWLAKKVAPYSRKIALWLLPSDKYLSNSIKIIKISNS